MDYEQSADLEELAACLDRAERLSRAAERTLRREQARELRRLREIRPGWTNARIREAAGPCPECIPGERACASCWAEAHADDRDDVA